MTHQYESEILNKLMERDGFNIPSSVPPYEAEIKAYLINQVTQGYPKLTDYEAEWLQYNYTQHLPADFPISSVTNVTEASFENVVPYVYKSAILKGQTLVNLINLENFTSTDILYSCELPVTNNTTYTVIATLRGSDKIRTSAESVFRIKANNDNGADLINIQQIMPNDISTIINLCRTIKITTQNNLHIRLYNTLPENLKIIILEGDHTQEDIPYFEGMQSVKMPVLTTTGKNLFDKEAFYNDWKSKQPTYMYKEIVDGEEVLKVNNFNQLWAKGNGFKISVKKDNPLIISMKCKRAGANGTMAVLLIRYGDNEHVALGQCNSDEWIEVNAKFTPSRDYIEICSGYNVNDYFYIKDIQLEVGSDKTPCEPYKTNILTVNEDVTLRSNGDVYDELNLLTGRLTQRIDENNVVLSQEVVKTVDLKTVNESGESVRFIPIEGTMHVSCNSQTIKPSFDMSVPVESTTQNLASFIDLEMEE